MSLRDRGFKRMHVQLTYQLILQEYDLLVDYIIFEVECWSRGFVGAEH